MNSLLLSASLPVKQMNQMNLSFKPRKIIGIMSLILLLSLSLVFLSKSDVQALPTRSGHSGGGVPSGIPANVGGFNRGALQSQSGGPLSGVQPNGGGTSPLPGLGGGLVLMLYFLALAPPIVLVLMLLILHVLLILQ
jgi:hypothetical protein